MNDNTCLTETNAPSNKLNDNPLLHVFPSSSFVTLDGDGIIGQMRSTLPDCSPVLDTTPEVAYVDGTEASDTNDHGYLLDNDTSDYQHACTSISAQNMNPELRHSVKSSFGKITISGHGIKQYCFFCDKCPSNLAHHLKVNHANKKEIIELASLETESAQAQSFKKLRNLGYHRHNQKVLRDRRGTLVVCRPKPGAKPEDYLPCRGCFQYVTKTELLRHTGRCPLSLQKSGKHNKHATGSNLTSSSSVSSDGIYVQKFTKTCSIDRLDHIHIQSVSNYFVNAAPRYLPCYFCGCWVTNIFRHLRHKHCDEPEMMEIMRMGLSHSAAETEHIRRIRNLGIHQHNVKVLKNGHGNFFVPRITERSAQSYDYLPCEYCWCYVSKINYNHHHCKLNTESQQANYKWDQQLFADAHFLLPTSDKFYDHVNDALDGIKKGHVKLVAQSDPLIGEYVAKLLSIKVAPNAVADKVQLLAQFLIEIRKQACLYNATLSDCISPEKFQQCVLAVKTLGHFDSGTSSYRSPATVLKIRNILREVSKLMKRDAMDKRDRHAVKDLDHFIQLCMSESNFSAKSSQAIISEVEPESD